MACLGTVPFFQFEASESTPIWFISQELEGVPEDVLSGLEKGKGEIRASFY